MSMTDLIERRWVAALLVSVTCGVLFALMAGGQPPVPVPGVAYPLFWLAWAPLTALAIITFLAFATPAQERRRWLRMGAVAALALGAASAVIGWGRTDDVAFLMALHLPLAAWAVVGASMAVGRHDRGAALYSFMVQSMEALVAGGIFLGAGMITGALTVGILSVLGVTVSETIIIVVAAFGIGAIPVVAVASVHDPGLAPTEQIPTGLARILRIMSWLLLPVALGVMALYVFWFIPTHFWRAFEDREVLIVYNATVIAILALFAAAGAPVDDTLRQRSEPVLRRVLPVLAGLTLLLNAYALAAIVNRTFEYGLTPNRHAVLGWNVVTLGILVGLLVRTRTGGGDWLTGFRGTLGHALLPAAVWAVWVAWGVGLL
jgi:hypothetical protein